MEQQRKDSYRKRISQHLNFYRIHSLFFIFTPLFFSIIFYACNGKTKISYIDSLFNCISAMTVCGLVTVDLSTVTAFQQVLLFVQMCIGNLVVISWVMVVIRKSLFAQTFINALRKPADNLSETVTETNKSWPRRFAFPFARKHDIKRLRPDMIRRLDSKPRPVNPSGWVPQEESSSAPDTANRGSQQRSQLGILIADNNEVVSRAEPSPNHISGPSSFHGPRRFEISTGETLSQRMPRTQTVEFAPEVHQPTNEFGSLRTRRSSLSLRRHPTQHSLHAIDTQNKNRGFGGFPVPWDAIPSLLVRLFPSRFKERITRTMTIPATMSITPSHANIRPGTKRVPYITFEAIVGRNSAFRQLTSDQKDELGGVEYRALKTLLWIIPTYHLSCQLVSFVIISAYISQPRWQPIFRDEQKPSLNPVWFAAFQVVSSYTNSGMSLVDQSMIPFQKATVMILVMIFLILAGNTAFPVFLRFVIWCNTKFVKKNSQLHESLHFLLDHPRRCFVYLFPSHQTWFLLTVVLGLTLIDWVLLLVLDIGNPDLQQIPLNTRILDALMQAVAVRAAGFVIIPLAGLAPAVKVLFVVMMYISVYPIAMSVRSTNVYEEQSLGIFHKEESDDEQGFDSTGPRLSVWSRYLTMHARRQLAFDMWWLVFSLFFICIIEKNNIENPSNFDWFSIFNIMFELVSAYGTVGLSLGIPNQNYSFAGSMHPLSKLIICVVMLRGRHRGLPLAIDRAIMLNSEMEEVEGLSTETDAIESEPVLDAQH